MNSRSYSIILCGQKQRYQLTRKKVKNINLRIHRDGSIHVSAPSSVPLWQIEDFLHRKAAWIFQALEKQKLPEAAFPQQCGYLFGKPVPIPPEEKPDEWLRRMAEEILPSAYEQAWALFQNDGFSKPQLRLRKMRSRWGSCIPAKGQITLNSVLIGTPVDCQIAVAAHELAHMMVPNHSPAFYSLLDERLPDYRDSHQKLKSAQSFLVHLW